MKKIIFCTAVLTLVGSHSYAQDSAAPSGSVTNQTTQQPAQAQTAPQPTTQQTIDCSYKIPADQTTISEEVVKTWSKNAALESFDFDHNSIDEALKTLEACYTKDGWKSFNDALDKSGNLKAIREQNLSVKSQVDGDISLQAVKENQWKVTVPMAVTYQNNKDKLTQLLSVDLLVGRKVSGDLGVMQLIAAPRVNPSNAQQPSPAPENKTPTNPAPANTQ